MRAAKFITALLVIFLLAPLTGAGAGGRAGPALSVSISGPVSNELVRGMVNITGSANGPDMANITVSISVDSGPYFTTRGTSSWFKGWDTLGMTNGPHTIRARAVDGTGDAIAEIMVTVDNAPPIIPRIINATPEFTNLTARLGSNLTFSVTLGGDTSMTGVIWLFNSLPEPGPSATNRSWEFNTPGNYTVEARYIRGELTLDVRVWNLTIKPLNHGPQFARASISPGNYTASKDDEADFKITATDPDGTDLIYFWSYDDKPLNITGPNATIKFGHSGNHRLRVVISDGETNISLRWNFEVQSLNPAGPLDYAPCLTYLAVGLMLGIIIGRRRAKSNSKKA